jgi:hypothetical protein
VQSLRGRLLPMPSRNEKAPGYPEASRWSG